METLKTSSIMTMLIVIVFMLGLVLARSPMRISTCTVGYETKNAGDTWISTDVDCVKQCYCYYDGEIICSPCGYQPATCTFEYETKNEGDTWIYTEIAGCEKECTCDFEGDVVCSPCLHQPGGPAGY